MLLLLPVISLPQSAGVTQETEEREESTTGFKSTRTTDLVGLGGRGGGGARVRGWGRDNYSGNNSNSSNKDFQRRNQEEAGHPEYTSKKCCWPDDQEREGSDRWVSQGRGQGSAEEPQEDCETLTHNPYQRCRIL